MSGLTTVQLAAAGQGWQMARDNVSANVAGLVGMGVAGPVGWARAFAAMNHGIGGGGADPIKMGLLGLYAAALVRLAELETGAAANRTAAVDGDMVAAGAPPSPAAAGVAPADPGSGVGVTSPDPGPCPHVDPDAVPASVDDFLADPSTGTVRSRKAPPSGGVGRVDPPPG